MWLQGPVLQDAAAANRRRCVRNALTNVAEQEHEDGYHARMSVPYARAMLAYHYTLAAIGKHMHNLRGVDRELTRGCAPGPPARLQRVDKCCHQQSRRI